MSALNRSTYRRLQHLPQIPSVWEGDRRPINTQSIKDLLESGGTVPSEGECILWVDGSQGTVRAMDVVTPETGYETVVRTLLRAMEHPHNPASPARPKKIVVRDRELQFFLRGVLQDLEIAIDYTQELPLIDEIFRGLQEAVESQQPPLPPQYEAALLEQAGELWDLAPWTQLEDHQILQIDVNRWDLGSLYVSIMGMLGMEYGVLLYRSQDSLKRFREQAIQRESMEEMQEAFLGQDCLYLTYEPPEDSMGLPRTAPPPMIEAAPVFGNLHPLEGLRTYLYEDEAAGLLVAVTALNRFFKQHQHQFDQGEFPALAHKYRIPNPEGTGKQTIEIKVSTLPELAEELLHLEDENDGSTLPSIRDDLVPDNSFISLGMIPWETLNLVKDSLEYHQPRKVVPAGDGLPIVMIQTSRPKAKALIQQLQAADGLEAICFNPGHDPLGGGVFELGLLRSGDHDLYLFGEFSDDDAVHQAARKKWEQRCKKTKGICGLMIAKGLTGASRGNPQPKDMMALFEAHAISANELGIGTLQLTLAVDWF